MITMKTLVGIVCALLLGVAVAFIKPAQPIQVVDTKPAFMQAEVGLDNPNIVSDEHITPARKCVSSSLSGASLTLLSSLTHIVWFLQGFCMGVSTSWERSFNDG